MGTKLYKSRMGLPVQTSALLWQERSQLHKTSAQKTSQTLLTMNGKLGAVLALLLVSAALSQGKWIPPSTHRTAALSWHLLRCVSSGRQLSASFCRFISFEMFSTVLLRTEIYYCSSCTEELLTSCGKYFKDANEINFGSVFHLKRKLARDRIFSKSVWKLLYLPTKGSIFPLSISYLLLNDHTVSVKQSTAPSEEQTI